MCLSFEIERDFVSLKSCMNGANKRSYSLRNNDLRDAVKRNILAVRRIARIEKVANLENDIASLK